MAALEAEARAIVEMVGRHDEATLREASRQVVANISVPESVNEQMNDVSDPHPSTPAEGANNSQQGHAETPMDVDQPGILVFALLCTIKFRQCF